MRRDKQEKLLPPLGRVRGHQVARYGYGRWLPATAWKANKILYEWSTIVAKLLLREGRSFGINGMYLEFANVASPGDTVPPPAFDRSQASGVAYYNSLFSDSTKDYLRVPLTAGTLEISDTDKFPGGNQPVFFAMSSGVAGSHGKPFSVASNSLVIGAALVAMPDEQDASQDLVFSRFYFEEDDQPPKLDTSQIGVEWELTLQ